MVVTKINYFPINRVKESQPLARCSVVLDNCLKLNDIKIFVGKDGRYIVFPDRADLTKYSCECQNTLSKNKGNECFHPVGRGFYEELKGIVLDGYARFERDGEYVYRPN